MTEPTLEQDFRQYLKYHVKDREPRIVNFYMGKIMEETFTNKKEKRQELEKLLEETGEKNKECQALEMGLRPS